MGILIIDGTSVFEIDEECIKKKKVPKECDVAKYVEGTVVEKQSNKKTEATE